MAAGAQGGTARSEDAGNEERAKVKRHSVCEVEDLENGIMSIRTCSQRAEQETWYEWEVGNIVWQGGSW